MKLSKCCDAEIRAVMEDDTVGHGLHETTECSDCGSTEPEEYEAPCKHERIFVSVRHESGRALSKCSDCGKKFWSGF